MVFPAAPERCLEAYLLGDHLDAALAAGEDLLALTRVLTGSSKKQTEAVRAFVEDVRRLEVTLTGRVVQARKRAQALARQDLRIKSFANLFVGGTAALVDAIAEFGDASRLDFDNGDDAIEYLATRAVLPAGALSLEAVATLRIEESFLVTTRIQLGALLDLVAAFLDAIDLLYDLYLERPEPEQASAVASAA